MYHVIPHMRNANFVDMEILRHPQNKLHIWYAYSSQQDLVFAIG